jgi:hypothetical protein
MSGTEGVWLSINDYSRYKNVSISTIRRHIKNNILKHKDENGKYFIYVHSTEKIKHREEEEILRLRFELELLKRQARELREENSELKMLIEVYERSRNEIGGPPALPGIL